MAKSFTDQEFDMLFDAWELHLSGFVIPVTPIAQQRPKHHYGHYKLDLWAAAEDNAVCLVGHSAAKRNVVECFIVGC